MPAILHHAHCGLVVPPNSPRELAAAMLHIASLPPPDRAALGHNARLEYESRFQPETMAAKYMEVYEQSLAPRRPRKPGVFHSP